MVYEAVRKDDDAVGQKDLALNQGGDASALQLRQVSMRWQSESHLHFWTHRFLRQLRSSELRQ